MKYLHLYILGKEPEENVW